MPGTGEGPALQQGYFVWCAFPEREAPLRPGPLHVAYTLAVAAVGDGYGVIVAYTTSQPWVGALPQGVIAFDRAEAASLGQTRAFVLDLRRLAYLPLTTAWFPRAGEAPTGVLGRAPKPLRDRAAAIAADLVKRRPETLSRTGPLWRSP
jgi:hypothetical protein